MKRFLTLLLAVIVLLPGLIQAEQISDVNLQTCIAAAAGNSYDSLSDKELQEITVLKCPAKDIASVEGMENLVNLVELDLNDNRVEDIRQLSGLKGLIKLELEHNRIVDISPVADLRQLRELFLTGNQIKEIGSLAKLSLLEFLLLGGNQIVDLGQLVGLTNITNLYIFNNRITDIKALKGLKRLEYLDGSGNSIDDVSVLSELSGLARLHLNGNSIVDIEGLAGLKSLKTLFLSNNMINNINPLANLAGLRIVDLSANNVDDISALRNLNNLKRLTLDNNLVSNISSLEDLPNLAHVSLLNNCVNEPAKIAHVKSVTGMEYQHDLCSSPNLVKRTITREWLDEQIGRQCEDYVQDSAKATHYDYDYCSDGLYYRIFIRNRDSDSLKRLVCHLPWDSDFGEFLRALETDADTTGSYRTYKYGNNVILYVQGDRIKGQSKKTRVSAGYEYELEAYMDIFKVRYEVERSELNGMEVLTARKNDHVVREIVGDEFHTLQFFEPGFYATEISKQQ